MFTIGSLIGAFINNYVMYMILHFLIFKRISSNPVKSNMSAVVATYFLASILYGFGSADGGPYVWTGFLNYLLPSLIVGCFAYRKARALIERQVDAYQDIFGDHGEISKGHDKPKLLWGRDYSR